MCRYGCDISIECVRFEEQHGQFIEAFDCGELEFNELVIKDAFDAKTVSYLFLEEETRQLVAYMSIACSGIMYAIETDTDDVLWANEATIIPAIEIKYFAVQKDFRHMRFEPQASRDQTLSAYILKYCMHKITNIAETVIGADKIILYAVSRAKRFYERCGFKRFETEMTRDADPFLRDCIPLFYSIPRIDEAG